MEKKNPDVELASMDISGSLVDQIRDQKLLESRTIFLSEPVTANLARRVIGDLLILDNDSAKDPIKLFVNSPGGEVNSGFAIFDTIRAIRPEVKVINAGLCASIATIINVAAKKKNRLTLANSRFMIHQPLIMGQIYGQASDLEITAQEILKTREKINKILAEECGRNLDQVSDDTSRDFWMTAEEALDYGLVTEVISSLSEL